jgi:pilus assembly protein CpaF
MRQQISLALDAVVHTSRLSDGTRKVMSVTEVVSMEGDTITMQDLFIYQREGVDAQSNVIGRFMSTGIRPHFAEKLKATSAVDASVLDFLTT